MEIGIHYFIIGNQNQKLWNAFGLLRMMSLEDGLFQGDAGPAERVAGDHPNKVREAPAQGKAFPS